jgi:hypothetical protein
MTLRKIGAVVAVVALAGSCSSHAAAAKPIPSPKLINVIGSIALTNGMQYRAAADGADCDASGTPGYSDMVAGTQVVVYDAGGKQLAIGTLGPGTTQAGACTFPFTIGGVPSGVGPYSVEVSHRGKIAFTEAQAGDVELTLGDSS